MLTKLGLIFLVALCAVGCARVTTTVTLNPDGSYSRSSTYSITKMNMGSKKEATFHEAFLLPPPPTAGPKWVQTDVKDEKHLTIVANGTVDAPPVGDVTILGPDQKPVLKSQGFVRHLADGNLEYHEVLHWVGPPLPGEADEKADDMLGKLLTTEFPNRTFDPAKLKPLSRNLQRQILRKCFGPPRPLLIDTISNADVGKMLIEDAIADDLSKGLREAFPDLTDQDIAKCLKSLDNFDPSDIKSLDLKGSSQNDPSADTSGLDPLLFVLEFPGKVVSTNGIVSRTGKIYWSLYAMAAQVGDVDLTATIDPKGNP